MPLEELKTLDAALRAELEAHPLVKRRRAAEQAFLRDLTRLAMKHGLVLRAECFLSYDGPIMRCGIETAVPGRYVEDEDGNVRFRNEEEPPLTRSQRRRIEAVLARRREEDVVMEVFRHRFVETASETLALGAAAGAVKGEEA